MSYAWIVQEKNIYRYIILNWLFLHCTLQSPSRKINPLPLPFHPIFLFKKNIIIIIIICLTLRCTVFFHSVFSSIIFHIFSMYYFLLCASRDYKTKHFFLLISFMNPGVLERNEFYRTNAERCMNLTVKLTKILVFHKKMAQSPSQRNYKE